MNIAWHPGKWLVPLSLVFVLPSSGVRAERIGADKPNVLIILVDDMGFADLSVMGNRAVRTPHIDRLAKEGALLTRFYDAAPVCTPSRVGLFTGRFPAELGFVTFSHTRAANATAGQPDWLDPEIPNLARLFAGAGYATGHFGKWHMGGGRDSGDAPWPNAYGFEESYVNFEGLGPRALIADQPLSKQSAALGQGPVDWHRKHRLTDAYADKLTAFVGRNRNHPWFVQLWPDDVHDGHAPSEEELARFGNAGRDDAERKFFAVLQSFDAKIGNMLAKLKALGELDNTLILLTSDNGPTATPRYYASGGQAPGSVANLRGRKWSLHEGGIRQPLIAWWPGRIRPGLVDRKSVVHAVDIYPTLAAVLGSAGPAGSHGIDLLPALSGRKRAKRPPLFWTTASLRDGKAISQPHRQQDRSPAYAVRDGKWKLLWDGGVGTPALYNLDADASETRDVAPSNPEIVARLRTALRQWIERLPSQKTITERETAQ